jgi:predicted CopG family antitoxin
MKKQIKVSLENYEKLKKLRDELGLATFDNVVGELIKVYEGYRTYHNMLSLYQLLNEIQQKLATVYNLLVTAIEYQEKVESSRSRGRKSAPKEASKSDLAAYLKR